MGDEIGMGVEIGAGVETGAGVESGACLATATEVLDARRSELPPMRMTA